MSRVSVAILFLLLPAPPPPGPEAPSHFPDRLHALVWRNWSVVPAERLAKVIGAEPAQVLEMSRSMGLPDAPAITPDQWKRSHITVIRRNWHLLPYEQLTELLGWTREQLDFTLREDDFLYIKLGNSKPACEPIRFAPPGDAARARAKEIAAIVAKEFPGDALIAKDPPFAFVGRLSAPAEKKPVPSSAFNPRFCYSYFALYGDPLLDRDCDPYPDGYLDRLAQSGVNGVWLQGVLPKLATFPWDPKQSERFEERRAGLKALVARAKSHGIGVYLYLNEPRSLPLAWFKDRPELKGVVEGNHAALCTSHPDVKAYMVESIRSLLVDVPDLAGLFTITASENLTNCWSHNKGSGCAACSKRTPAETIAEVNVLLQDGIRKSGASTRLIAWDWGWTDAAAPDILAKLPAEVSFMSVSEWNVPIERGGVKSAVGEYSISAIGPGPRALRHFEIARKRGLKVLAKIQAGCTWELSSVPYIPAVFNVAKHAENLRAAGVDGLMLGWTLGGYPSPNLEVVAELGAEPGLSAENAVVRVARRRYGAALAPKVVAAWRHCSDAFSQFPFHIATVYTAPLQYGPSNLLWDKPTGRKATMLGFPYDDLDAWRAVYPPETFVKQLTRVSLAFEVAAEMLTDPALAEERRIILATALHFRSTAVQAGFVDKRRGPKDSLDVLENHLREELDLAKQLAKLQSEDSRIGFEASNHYYYRPIDLAEKVLNCRDLLDRWIPSLR